MATLKQIAANRRNAQRSTGPRTPEGKIRFEPKRPPAPASMPLWKPSSPQRTPKHSPHSPSSITPTTNPNRPPSAASSIASSRRVAPPPLPPHRRRDARQRRHHHHRRHAPPRRGLRHDRYRPRSPPAPCQRHPQVLSENTGSRRIAPGLRRLCRGRDTTAGRRPPAPVYCSSTPTESTVSRANWLRSATRLRSPREPPPPPHSKAPGASTDEHHPRPPLPTADES
jgi:hypothetical protein